MALIKRSLLVFSAFAAIVNIA
jgi:hypothetical protein